jgi:hypothetical protein
MKKKIITRRDFLKDSASFALAGSLMTQLPVKMLAEEGRKSRVVLIRHQDVFDKDQKLQEEIVSEMLDQAVTTLTGASDVKKAWKQLINPTDIVGIKSNIWHYLPTPPSLESAIVSGVRSIGVAEKNIGIDDRGILRNPIFKNATALINVRPLRTHYWSGVGTLLKNYIMFVEKPSDYHDDTCADLAKIWKLPHIEGKTRLNILVMFTPLFHSIGPHAFNAQYTWAYRGLLVGLDPVAVDATGLRILLARRQEYFQEERPLNPPAKHIYLADSRHHLGTADPAKIDLIKLGWQDGALI